MQSVTDLTKLRDAIAIRVLRLRAIVSPVSSPLGACERRAIAFVAIELDNLIVVGLRSYTKSSLLRSRTSSGDRITASVAPKTTEEAAAYIYKSLNPTGYSKLRSPSTILEKDEIIFRDPKRVEKVLLDYSASNIQKLTLALSLNADVFFELKIFRHYFAHRTKSTREKVRDFSSRVGAVSFDMPEHIMLKGRPNTGVRFIDGWLADVENFFDLAS